MIINFELLKVSTVTSLENSSHGEAKNVKFGQQVHLIQKVSLGYSTSKDSDIIIS